VCPRRPSLAGSALDGATTSTQASTSTPNPALSSWRSKAGSSWRSRISPARARSPWWHDTRALLVEGPSGVVLYGELDPDVEVGDAVERGGLLGHVRTVLRRDKGLPMTMLHLERYAPGTRASVWWRHGEPRPDALLDPTAHLVEAVDDGSTG